MANPSDMLKPVTRGELQEELKQLRLEIKQAIEPLATKVELELWGGALLSHITSVQSTLRQEMQELRQDMRQEMQELRQDMRQELQQDMQDMRQELQQDMRQMLQDTQQTLQLDLARHANALHESMVALVHAHDDKYADLPVRVRRLEFAVFEPTPR